MTAQHDLVAENEALRELVRLKDAALRETARYIDVVIGFVGHEHRLALVVAKETIGMALALTPADCRARQAAIKAVVEAARHVKDADWAYRSVPEEVSELDPAFEALDALASPGQAAP